MWDGKEPGKGKLLSGRYAEKTGRTLPITLNKDMHWVRTMLLLLLLPSWLILMPLLLLLLLLFLFVPLMIFLLLQLLYFL